MKGTYLEGVTILFGTPSVRHQHWHRHGFQDAAGDPAQNELAQTRMAIAAKHHEVSSGVDGVRQDRILHAGAPTGEVLDLDRNAVACEMAAHVGASDLTALVALAGDDDDVDRLGALKEGQ